METLKNIPIFIIRGFFSNKVTLTPLKMYLENNGHPNVHIITYPVSTMTFEQALDCVDTKMSKIVNKDNQQVIVIGHSFGGLIANNLHRIGWNIRKGIYLATPMKGAKLLDKMDKNLHRKFMDVIDTKAGFHLRTMNHEEDPGHEYHTISLGMFWSEFDGFLNREETIIGLHCHEHVKWCDHTMALMPFHLWKVILKKINGGQINMNDL